MPTELGERLADRLLHGATWAGGGKILSMAFQLVLTVILARGLSQEEYGIYFVLLSAIVVFATVGTLGLDQVVVRFVSAHLAAGNTASARSVIIKTASGVMASAAIVAGLFVPSAQLFFRSNPEYLVHDDVLLLTAAWLFLATCQRHIAETFRGIGDIRLATLLGGVRNNGIINAALISGGIVALWLLDGLTLHSVMLTMLTAALTVVGLGSALLAKQLGYWKPQRASSSLPFSILLHEAWPLSIAAQILVFSSMGSMWIAGAILPPQDVAQYGVAMRFVAVLLAPMAIMAAVLPPTVAHLFAAGHLAKLEYVLRGTATIAVLMGAVVYASLILLGERGTVMIFGNSYDSAFPILLILCGGQIANLATGGWQILLPMSGQRRTVLLLAVVSVTLQLGLSILWGSSLGLIGIALGVCVSTVVTNVLGAVVARYLTGVSTWLSFSPRPVFAALRQLKGRFGTVMEKNTP